MVSFANVAADFFGLGQSVIAQIDSALPTTGSVGHYKTKSLGAGTAAALVVFFAAIFFRKQILREMRESIAFRIIVLISSPIMAVILSAIASWEDLFRPATYEATATNQPDWHTLVWAAIWSAGSMTTIIAAFFTLAFKEGEEIESKKLERDLGNERTARASVERQRQHLTDIATFVMKIVKTKKDRLKALIGRDFSMPDFFQAIDPKAQIVLLVKVMHEFFMPDQTDPAFVLRMGLFVRDEDDIRKLAVLHSWDGANENCFRDRSDEYLQLDSPHGSQSAIVRCFHSTDGCIVIPNHQADAVANAECHLMPKGHEGEAASVVAYKHVYRSARNEDDAMIVILVASKTDYFKQEEKPEIRQFLDEMLTRLELEWMISESVDKLNVQAKTK